MTTEPDAYQACLRQQRSQTNIQDTHLSIYHCSIYPTQFSRACTSLVEPARVHLAKAENTTTCSRVSPSLWRIMGALAAVSHVCICCLFLSTDCEYLLAIIVDPS